MQRSVTILSPRDTRLAAIVHNKIANNHVLVIAHGMLSNKSSLRHKLMAKIFCEHNNAAIRFDFSGRGNSSGTWKHITPLGEVTDLLSVIEYAHNKGAKEISLFGSSLGGAIAIMAAAQTSIKRLATWAAVGDFNKVPIWNDPQLLAAWKQKGSITISGENIHVEFLHQAQKINLPSLAKKITAPTLIAHGACDDSVPFINAEILHKQIKHATLYKVENADHRLSNMEQHTQVTSYIARWMAS